MGFFDRSSSKSESITDITTKTQSIGSLGDLEVDSAQGIGASLSNILDSNVSLAFEQHGLSGTDVLELVRGAVKPGQDLAAQTIGAFTAAQSSRALLQDTVARAFETVQKLAIPAAIVAGLYVWSRAR